MIKSKVGIKGVVELRQFAFTQEAHKLFDVLKAKYPHRGVDERESKGYQEEYYKIEVQHKKPKFYYKKSWVDKFLGNPFRPFFPVTNNLVTNLGDALIAQALIETRTETPINNANGEIGLGTNYSTATKTSSTLGTQVGTYATMDSGYPAVGGAWAASGDNIIHYYATFATGSLAAVDINEALLTNGTYGAAYTNVNTTTVESTDTIQIRWSWIPLGA